MAPDRLQVDLSSSSCPRAVGVPDAPAPQPLTHEDLLDRAVALERRGTEQSVDPLTAWLRDRAAGPVPPMTGAR